MLRWIVAERDSFSSPSPVPEDAIHFAAPHGEEVQLWLELAPDGPPGPLPTLQLRSNVSGCEVQVLAGEAPGAYRVGVRVPPAPQPAEDDEVVLDLQGEPPGDVPPCRVVLRRTTCAIGTALLDRHPDAVPLRAQTRAALLWYGWKRYQEVVGLKRFTTGLGGSDVLVFRPRLREPDASRPVAREAGLPGAVCEAWGSCLLVKTGACAKVWQEWARFQTFLVDRLHPFMARSEAYLTVRAAEDAAQPQATIIGSFLGGDLLQVEPFEQLVRGTSDVERCLRVLNRLFSVLATWYAGSCTRPLGEWRRVFAFADDGRLLLCGQFDLSREEDRNEYAAGLGWDIPFVKEDHLSRHWLGKRDGLLYRLRELPVRYSLVHGDLHPRNVLADRDNVWLIDFGVTGVAPSLCDFAKLEVYLRQWGITLTAAAENFEEAVAELETQLLDRMTGTEGGLEFVRTTAANLGARSDDLQKIAQCILEIRRLAMPYTLGTPGQRDYLAVLYLTAISTLRYSSTGAASPANIRWLVGLAWVLEDVLSRFVGLEPFPRGRAPMDHKLLLTRRWLAAPGAPGRVAYVLDRPDGRKALEPLAATRGVLQNPSHHLDVFDHTLLMLAYLEALLSDQDGGPLAGFLDPARLDRQVEEDLRRQGIFFPPVPHRAEETVPRAGAADSAWKNAVQQQFQQLLDPETRLVLKWAALFHDVGKPATRCVNAATRSRPDRVQFLGHEVYGRQLVAGHLRQLFPEDELRERVEHLMDRHHTHHQLTTRYLGDPERLEVLRQAVAGGEVVPAEWKSLARSWDPSKPHACDFPLLILHGYADTLACRGPEADASLPRVAELDLILLGLYFRYRQTEDVRAREQQARELTRGLDHVLGLPEGRDLGKVLQAVRAWCVEEMARRAEAGEPGPTREEAMARARQLARPKEDG